MLTIVSTDFNFKRTCLQTLLWSGLLFQSRCDNEWAGGSTSELGVLGSPIIHTSTITLTTTIAYNPAAAPPDSMYSLLGCYGLDTGDPEGNLFGKDGDYVVPAAVPDGQLTIRACLEGCDNLVPLKKSSDHYRLVGLSNGRECFCGSKLVAEARKLTLGDCDMPCTGDPELSCGGEDTVAVYGLIVASKSGRVTSQDETQDSSQCDETGGESGITPTGTSLSSAVDTSAALKATDSPEPTETEALGGSQQTSGKAIIPSSTLLPSSDPADAPTSGPAIAAITGSVSGAIILAALIILCVRAYKRKKLHEAACTDVIAIPGHQQEGSDKQLPRRPVPSAIDTTGRQLRDLNRGIGRVARDGHERGYGKRDEDISAGASMDGTYLVPSTPALESGTRLRHPDHSARLTAASLPTSESDTLYGKLMDEVRAGPAAPVVTPSPPSPPPSATSSSVQWRGNPLKPLTPSAASTGQFNFDFSAKPSVSTPAPAARSEATLGDRAWHRRKVSKTFQPPASGPPSIPLPPTPPRRQQQRAFDPVHFTPTPASRVKPSHSQHDEGEKKEGPRAAALPAALPLGLAGPAGQGSGRTGTPTPPLKDSPTIPQAQGDFQDSRREGLVGTGRETDGEAGMRLLPPNTPAGQLDYSLPNRDTIYTVGEEEEDWPVDGGSETKGADISPVSTNTVGTSILFPSDDEQEAIPATTNIAPSATPIIPVTTEPSAPLPIPIPAGAAPLSEPSVAVGVPSVVDVVSVPLTASATAARPVPVVVAPAVSVVVYVTVSVVVGPQLQPEPQPTQPLNPPSPFQPHPGPTNHGDPSNAQPVTVATPPVHVRDDWKADAHSLQYCLYESTADEISDAFGGPLPLPKGPPNALAPPPQPPGAAHVTEPPEYVTVRTPVLPADVHSEYWEHRELESEVYDSKAVEDEDVAHALLMHEPMLLPWSESQYSDCAGQPLVTVAVGLDQAEERQDCFRGRGMLVDWIGLECISR
ncbi:hypothetical protein F4814DRAFT_449427 [Daldinia grandis]|nr:hypothetical protein F4814DRAFT_449427 [Daldinia grandis]